MTDQIQQRLNTNQLTPGTYFLVEGELEFSRLYSRIEGDELVRRNQQSQQRGISPDDKPLTTATIKNAKVLPLGAEKSKEEIYAEQRFYTSNDPAQAGIYKYTGKNKGNYLPRIYQQKNPSDNTLTEIELKADLATETKVILIMKIFSAPRNNGVSLEGVIVKGDINTYARGTDQFLESLGYNVVGLENDYSEIGETTMEQFQNNISSGNNLGGQTQQYQNQPPQGQNYQQQNQNQGYNQQPQPQQFGQQQVPQDTGVSQVGEGGHTGIVFGQNN